MTDQIDTFFSAWQLESREDRLERITNTVAPSIVYVDPRTPEPITSIAALSEYIGMFSANAPGWSAKVVVSDTIAGITRATVAFSGKGPDGTKQTQLYLNDGTGRFTEASEMLPSSGRITALDFSKDSKILVAGPVLR